MEVVSWKRAVPAFCLFGDELASWHMKMASVIRKSETEEKLLALCEPVLTEKGFTIVDIDCRMSGKPMLRLFIDRSSSTGGPSIDDCAQVSRLLDPVLESSTLLTGPYELEVSSPGLDRRLRVASDFEAAIGSEVALSLLTSAPGLGANVKGDLVKVDLENVTIGQGVKNRKEFTIPFSNIKKANKVWHFETNRP